MSKVLSYEVRFSKFSMKTTSLYSFLTERKKLAYPQKENNLLVMNVEKAAGLCTGSTGLKNKMFNYCSRIFWKMELLPSPIEPGFAIFVMNISLTKRRGDAVVKNCRIEKCYM